MKLSVPTWLFDSFPLVLEAEKKWRQEVFIPNICLENNHDMLNIETLIIDLSYEASGRGLIWSSVLNLWTHCWYPYWWYPYWWYPYWLYPYWWYPYWWYPYIYHHLWYREFQPIWSTLLQHLVADSLSTIFTLFLLTSLLMICKVAVQWKKKPSDKMAVKDLSVKNICLCIFDMSFNPH